MPKKRKTRKQKMQATVRHQPVAVSAAPTTSDVKLPERFTLTQPKNTFTATTLYPHQYVKQELIKISMLSAGIVIGELILYVLLRNHIIALPFINY